MRYFYKLICLLLFFSLFHYTYSSTIPILIYDSANTFDISKNLYIYEDINNQLSIEQIREKEGFVLNKDNNINYGFSFSNIWIKFNIINKGSTEKEYYLVVRNPDLNKVLFYEYIDTLLSKQIVTGKKYLFNSRIQYNRNFVFVLNLKPNTCYTYFICSNNNGDANFIPVNLYKSSEFILNESDELIFNGLFFGLCFFIILFNFFFFITINDKLYLYYTIYVLLNSLFLFNITGFSSQFLWPNCSWLAIHTTIIFPSLNAFFLLLFTQLFFKTKLNSIVNSGQIILKYFALVICVLAFFNNSIFLISIYSTAIITPLILIMIIVISIIRINGGDKLAYYFLGAFTLTIIGLLIHLFKDAGIFPENHLTLNAFKLGFGIEMIILSFAITERFRLEQNKTQQKLQQQKNQLEDINIELEKLSIIADKTDNSVVVFNSKNKLEWANNGFIKISGYSMEELMTGTDEQIKVFQQFTTSDPDFLKCVETKSSVVFERSFVNKDHQVIWFYTTLTPILDVDGNIFKVISISSDITILKEHEQILSNAKDKAEESDKLKSAFLANMSHEIRTPLNVISGFTEIIADDNITSDQKKEYSAYIRSSVDNLLNLINDIVDLSKIEAQKINITLSECRINQVINELYISMNQFKQAKQKEQLKLQLIKGNSNDNFTILTDQYRLTQVLTNLLVNAIKFTEKGHVRFGYSYDNIIDPATGQTYIEFFVEDTGIGIPQDKLSVIFDRFRKLEESNTKLYRGVGLGLAIAKNVVELLGGQLHVQSQINVGSTFVFKIPLAEIPMLDNFLINNEKHIVFDFNNKTVLLAEDEEFNYKIIDVLAKRLNISLIWVKNGKEAVEIIKDNIHVDLILMDIKMPILNGIDATKIIKSINNSIPVIAYTAYAMDGDKLKCKNAGCDDYITKPIKFDEFVELLVKYLGE